MKSTVERTLRATAFSPTDEQRLASLDDIAYEIEQVIGVCMHLIDFGPGPSEATAENQQTILTANVYLEAFLLHTRVLLDFFEKSARTVRFRAELDDVLAQDYGFPANPIPVPEALRRRINQDIAHLTYSRAERRGDNSDWFPESMARPLLERCDLFAEHLLKSAAPEAVQDRYREIRGRTASLLQAAPEAS